MDGLPAVRATDPDPFWRRTRMSRAASFRDNLTGIPMSDETVTPEAGAASGLNTKQVKRRMTRIQGLTDPKQVRQSHYKLMRDVLQAIADGSTKAPKRIAAAALLPKRGAEEQGASNEADASET